ncbi:energy transducer TonB [Sphingobacterium multivorum]|uniref:energy transducer TonB n=1 Tax=Sphingobacterium TaxID=28453 RepID=UPI0025802889|nr:MULTISPECIES: hypothetical protein [Sphingobacterium]
MRCLTLLFIYFSSTLIAFSQINYQIKDAIGLLISNPQFIESAMQSDGYQYTGTEMDKFHTYKKLDNPLFELTYTSNNDRINVLNWSEDLNQENYNSIITELKSLGFSKFGNSLKSEHFNTAMLSFENLRMNCVISMIQKQNENLITLTIGRKDNNKPLICPNQLTTFQGRKIFTDGLEGWNLDITISGEQISIKNTPHPNNADAKREHHSNFIIKGYIKNGIIYSTIPEEGAKEIHPSVYKYFKGNMYESNIENGYNKYSVDNKVSKPKIPIIARNKTLSIDNVIDKDTFLVNSAEIPAEPKEGIKSLKATLSKIIYSTPKNQGTPQLLSIYFIVEKTGKLSNFKILKTSSGNIGEKCIEYLKTTEFRPAIQNGRSVRQEYYIHL